MATNIPQQYSIIQKIIIKVFELFKLNIAPTLKLYKGFGNSNTCIIYGHALSLSPFSRKKFRNFFLINSLALLRLFMVKPLKNGYVQVEINGEFFETTTQKDGFFKLDCTMLNTLEPGIYITKATLFNKAKTLAIATAAASVIIPNATSFAFISDIDDTFLISHSANLRKRLFVLLTENAKSRKPFEGAVNHYRKLHGLGDANPANNAFFYVSSSEWNLYDYINDFVKEHTLPNGVFLLNQIKTFSKLFSTGQNNHEGKFTRIVKIIEAYPLQKFVLLGDDSQKDIDIYTAIVEHFPQNVYAVYIRRVGHPQKENVLQKKETIEKAGIHFFYFAHSNNAIAHSQHIGLI